MHAHWLKKVVRYAVIGEVYATFPGKTPVEVAGTYAYAHSSQLVDFVPPSCCPAIAIRGVQLINV